jgi:K+-transporting ATPase ATPase C chain
VKTQPEMPIGHDTAENGLMASLLRPAISLFFALSIITGLLYPLLTTGIAGALFPTQAAGSLIENDGSIVGSALIGQSFSDPAHFRPPRRNPTMRRRPVDPTRGR